MAGHVTVLVRIPMPYPYGEKRLIHSASVSDGQIYVYINPEKNWEITLIDSQEQRTLMKTQPIEITAGDWAILQFGWDGETSYLFVNDAQVLPIDASDQAITLALGERTAGPLTRSVDAQDAVAQCFPWMSWRSQHLSRLRTVSTRRTKASHEHVDELRSAAERLMTETDLILHGKHQWIGPIAVEARSLVCWNDAHFRSDIKPRVYQNIPLLLRVAQYGNLPLPVYVGQQIRTSLPVAEMAPEPQFVYLGNVAFLEKQGPDQLLVDLQEWLTSPAYYSVDENRPAVEVRTLIAGVAEVLGPAHYDTGIPFGIDSLQNFEVPDGDLLTQFLVQTSLTVLGLTDWVLSHVSGAAGSSL